MLSPASSIAVWTTVAPDAIRCCCRCCRSSTERLRLIGALPPATER